MNQSSHKRLMREKEDRQLKRHTVTQFKLRPENTWPKTWTKFFFLNPQNNQLQSTLKFDSTTSFHTTKNFFNCSKYLQNHHWEWNYNPVLYVHCCTCTCEQKAKKRGSKECLTWVTHPYTRAPITHTRLFLFFLFCFVYIPTQTLRLSKHTFTLIQSKNKNIFLIEIKMLPKGFDI